MVVESFPNFRNIRTIVSRFGGQSAQVLENTIKLKKQLTF